MGDKSPKSKKRNAKQKSIAKERSNVKAKNKQDDYSKREPPKQK